MKWVEVQEKISFYVRETITTEDLNDIPQILEKYSNSILKIKSLLTGDFYVFVSKNDLFAIYSNEHLEKCLSEIRNEKLEKMLKKT